MKKLLTILLIAIVSTIHSQQTTTTQSGNWSDNMIWDNGVPGNNDTAIINHTVTLDANNTLSKVVINDTLINTSSILQIKTEFRNNGHYESVTGCVRFRSAGGDKNIYGITWFNKLDINSNDSIFTNDTIYVKNRLNIKNGVLDVSNGVLILKNDSINTGRLGKSANGEIIGEFIWQKCIDRCNEWSTYSSPFDASLNNIASNSGGNMIYTGFPDSNFPTFSFTNAYMYNEATGWIVPTSANSTINRGVGYWYWNSDTIYNTQSTGIPQQWQIELKGSIDLSQIFNFNISYSTDGYNLLGNPYPGTIDWDNLNWSKTNVNDAIYTFNTCNQLYASYIAGVGTNGGSGIISSGQGFYVQANGASPSLTCNQKVIVNQNEQLKAAVTTKAMFITLNNDEIAIAMDSNATNDFDFNYDASKFFGDYSTIYSILDSNEYSINTIKDSSYSVPIMIRGEGSLNFNGLSSFADYNVILEDAELNTFTDLHNTSNYAFSNSNSINYSERFIIHFSLNTTSVFENENDIFSIYPNPFNDIVFINGNYKNLEITNGLGQIVYSSVNKKQLDLSHLDNGLYFVKIDGVVKRVIKN